MTNHPNRSQYDYSLLGEDGELLSRNPNPAGARLSALFHVQNGETIIWEGPTKMRGCVNDVCRFVIVKDR